MPLSRVKIENYKSIGMCDLSINDLNLLIGENGSGKTNILDAIRYFYSNLLTNSMSNSIYDVNNKYSNCAKITLYFDLQEFVKISKTNTDSMVEIYENAQDKIRYGNYYKSIISLASKAKNNIIALELKQIKGRTIEWNYPYEDRAILKSLFPFFYIDTRNLDITEWSYIWDIFSELSKVSNFERNSIEYKICEIIDNNQEMAKKIEGIKTILESSNVDIKRTTAKSFAKILTQIYFSGNTIFQKGRKLNYYSTGTNTVKYIELLLKSINELARTKLKEPIVLFDEPEISLHPSFVDELSTAITEVNQKVYIFLSTHSSRLIKNIVTQCVCVNLYNIKLVNNYTCINLMKRFVQYSPKSKYRVTDEHINSYFATSILFVEGESELELFANPYLRALYPKLKKVDVFKAMSEEPLLNIMHPNKVKMSTPYLCLIDMDKALGFNIETKTLSLKKEYFKNNDKEKFLFRNKKEKNVYRAHTRNHIERMVNGLRVHFFSPFYSCKDEFFYDLLSEIQNYLMQYGIFAFRTTIEGALINANTYDFALSYLKSVNKQNDFEDFLFWLKSLQKNDQINALRIAYRGKSDLLQSYGKKIRGNLGEEKSLVMDRVMIEQKASGWISNYLDLFFKENTGELKKLTVRSFEAYLEDDENKKNIIKKFASSFPEIHSLISNIML